MRLPTGETLKVFSRAVVDAVVAVVVVVVVVCVGFKDATAFASVCPRIGLALSAYRIPFFTGEYLPLEVAQPTLGEAIFGAD